jgi:hypothetical protein
MYDRMTIQAEVDYRRERLTQSMGRKRRSLRSADRTRIPFVGGSEQVSRRAR